MKFLILSLTMISSIALGADKPTITTKEWPTSVLQGTPATLGDAKTKLIILDFWASWCEPCRESLPFYSSLQKKYAAKGVHFIGVSADESQDDAKKFLKDVHFDFPAVWDQNHKLVDLYKLESIPALVILSKDGKFLGQENGFTKSTKNSLPKKIDALLKAHE